MPRKENTGYEKNNLMYVFLSGDMQKNYDLIKSGLLEKGIAFSVSKTSAPMTEGWSSGGASWTGKNPNDRTEFNFYSSDGNLVKTAGLQLMQGRDIDLKNYPTDFTAVVINEAAVKAWDLKILLVS